MKTLRRNKLMQLAQQGKLVCVESYHYDEMSGQEIKKGDRPVCFLNAHNDYKEGFCNLREHDFTSSCGRAYLSDDKKTVSLYVHSNLHYDFRIVGDEAAPVHNSGVAKAKRPENARVKSDAKATHLEQSTKLRALAEGLTAKIEDKRRPMTQNPTPKRNREYRSRLHDSDNMERTQRALLALADAHEAGTVPTELLSIKTKAQVEPLVYKGTEGGGYYEVIPSHNYRDTSAAGKALQAMIDRPAAKDNKREISLLEQKISLSNIPSFFETPPELVQRMIDFVLPEAGEKILEPSAGSGAIACALMAKGCNVEACEVNFTLRELLTLKGVNLVGNDFMDRASLPVYDAVMMNPPFENGSDVDHIRKAYDCIKEGGRLAAICSPSFTSNSSKRHQNFKKWLEEIGADIEDIPAGAFKRSGTGVSAKLILIKK